MVKNGGKYLKTSPKRPVLRPVLLVLILLVVASTSMLLAYYLRDGGTIQNIFKTEQVSCQVQEAFDGTKKSSVTVNNTSTVDVYIRVRLVSYWKTPSGKITGMTSVTPKLATKSLLNATDWIADETNDTYYYRYRVSKDGSTNNLLTEGETITLESIDGYIQVIEVLAEAIQADGQKDGIPAVKDAWGVTLDADGNITGVNQSP